MSRPSFQWATWVDCALKSTSWTKCVVNIGPCCRPKYKQWVASVFCFNMRQHLVDCALLCSYMRQHLVGCSLFCFNVRQHMVGCSLCCFDVMQHLVGCSLFYITVREHLVNSPLLNRLLSTPHILVHCSVSMCGNILWSVLCSVPIGGNIWSTASCLTGWSNRPSPRPNESQVSLNADSGDNETNFHFKVPGSSGSLDMRWSRLVR